MKYSNAAVQQNDAKLISKTLLKLATPRIIMRAAVIIVTIIVWLWVASRILEFGAVQDYAFMNKFNVQLVTFLQSINTYLWWAVVLLGTLIVYFFLSAWYSGSVERAAYKAVPADTAAQLIGSLSAEGRDVLGWVWRDRSEPINIGNLKTTKDELDSNRVSKLAQIREQERLLGPGTAVAADNRIAASLAHNETHALSDQPLKPQTETIAVQSDAAASPIESVAPVTPIKPAAPAKADTQTASKPAAEPHQVSDVASSTHKEPALDASLADVPATDATPAPAEPTVGLGDNTTPRSARDEVKHTIT